MNTTYYVPPRFKGPSGQEDMPYLLTAGPLTTSRGVKLAMLVDYGAQDTEFRTLVADVRREVKRLAGGDESHECILLQGPGTYAVEAALGCLTPDKRRKTLVISNGVSGARAAIILEKLDRHVVRLTKDDRAAVTAADVEAALEADKEISHVWLTHCETGSGIINPVAEIGKLVKDRGKVFMVDAIASFGALPIDLVNDQIDVMISAGYMCLESVPGVSFVVVKRDMLIASEGKSQSVVLDLHDQWKELEGNGGFRFTPPTHAMAALRQALRELEAEGGIGMRRARYQRNAEELITRMRAMGFTPLVADTEAGPITQCFLAPGDAKFDYSVFHEGLRQRGFVIAPGLLGKPTTFRIGTIGQVNDKVIKELAKAIEAVLKEMDVQEFGPGAS